VWQVCLKCFEEADRNTPSTPLPSPLAASCSVTVGCRAAVAGVRQSDEAEFFWESTNVSAFSMGTTYRKALNRDLLGKGYLVGNMFTTERQYIEIVYLPQKGTIEIF